MTPEQIVEKARKVIKLYKESSMIKGVYFNPMFTSDLAEMVPELAEEGIHLSLTEVDSKDGQVVMGRAHSKGGTDVKLGSILLDGEEVRVKHGLITIERLLDYFTREMKLERAK